MKLSKVLTMPCPVPSLLSQHREVQPQVKYDASEDWIIVGCLA